MSGGLQMGNQGQGTLMNRHLGRQGLVRNLMDHLVDGTSAIVTGGPGMGKSTLLKQAAALMIKESAPVLIDLHRDVPGDRARRIPGGSDPVVLMVDACETLLPDPADSMKRIILASVPIGRQIRGMVWAGDMAWGEWAMGHKTEFGGPVRFYPLIVLPPKEARPFLISQLPEESPPAEIERFLELTGGHPYLLSWVLGNPDLECDAFFSNLWDSAGQEEKDLLNVLVGKGSWVFLEALRNQTGGRYPKKVLDRLAGLGLIIRTLVDGAAAVKGVSPLLGEWVLEKGRMPSKPQGGKEER